MFDSDSIDVAHEALNEIQAEGVEEMLNAEDQDNTASSEYVTGSSNGNSETFNGAATTTRSQLPSETAIEMRFRPENSQDDPLFRTIEKLGERFKDLSVELGRLVDCFQFMADDAARKRKVYGVISKMEGLTEEEVIKVGAIITSDTAKTNYLFSIPDPFKKIFVGMILGGSQ